MTPFRCGNCGGTVAMRTGAGGTWTIGSATYQIPADHPMATCGTCGEQYLSAEDADELDRVCLERGVRGHPAWFKPDRDEYRNSDVLTACAYRGMTAEQALDALARYAADLFEVLRRAADREVRPIVLQVSQEEFDAAKERLGARDGGES